ncbi:hypothetical protein TCAL_16889 [Tigriopus californicus]|uniref:Reverse transcriptase/retrotransposon-derived protein RNase H-like domain-containing protein n=1 Tax=Tigriopus californicus TaxID=6832 RepID=A0A553P6G1_TIGCA|nr:hypothetical protein TCAL_16889 [Tigriopus californicus]
MRESPQLTLITELRSFFELLNPLTTFLPNLSDATEKLTSLLKKNVAFLWTKEHEAEFEQAHVALTLPALYFVMPFERLPLPPPKPLWMAASTAEYPLRRVSVDIIDLEGSKFVVIADIHLFNC